MRKKILPFFVLLGTAAFAQYPVYDASFNGTGKYIQTNKSGLNEVSLHPDGSIAVVGNATASGESSTSFYTLKLKTDGTPDQTFNTSGDAFYKFSPNDDDKAYFVKVDSKGRTVLFGRAQDAYSSIASVVRYTKEGVLDKTFNSTGAQSIDVDGKETRVMSGDIQSDGKIVLSGLHRYNGSQWQVVVIRLNEDGSLDSGFGTSGIARIPVTDIEETAHYTLIQPDGKILIAGNIYLYATSSRQFLVLRLDANGTLDTSFGTNGKAAIKGSSSTDTGESIALQADGKIVGVGRSESGSLSIFRLKTNGVADSSFNATGIKLITASGSSSYYDVEINTDGSIVAVGGNGTYPIVSRFATNGDADTQFGTAGTYTLTDIQGAAYGLSISKDGKLVLVGSAGTGGFVARLEQYKQTSKKHLTFIPDNDTRVTIPHGSQYNFGTTGTFTIEAIVNGENTSSFPMIVSKRGNYAFQGFFVATNGGVPFIQLDGVNFYPTSSVNVLDGKCHHIAFSVGLSVIRYYIDGELKGTMPVGRTSYDVNTTASLVIGSDEANSFTNNWDGNIHEVRIWSGERSDEQIKKEHNTEISSKDGLIALWKLDEGTGQTVTDHSSFSNNGVLGTNNTVESTDPIWEEKTCTIIASVSESQNSKNQVAVYPNPFTTEVMIQLEEATTYELYNTQSVLMQAGNVTQGKALSFNNLEAGVYVLKVTANGKTLHSTIVKQ